MLVFIHDLLWLWVLGAVVGTGYIAWAQFIRGPLPASAPVPAPRSRPQPPVATPRTVPLPPPAPTRPAPSGSALPTRTPSATGSPEYQRRGSAPTQKLNVEAPAAATKPSQDDDAASELFSGLAAKPAPAPAPPKETPKELVAQAGRIEDYGFHVGSKAATETEARDARTATEANKPLEGLVPPQDRSQTQELDDILKRIDAVLSESDAPAAEATLTDPTKQGSSGQATLPVSAPPPAEKPDRKLTDPNQQKLF